MIAIELFDKRDPWRFQDSCILIKETQYPEMYPEFAPGPPDDDLFPEYWNTAVDVYLVQTEKETCVRLSSTMMRDFYKYVHGMMNRKHYWRIMKYLEHKRTMQYMESKEN